MHSTKTSQEEGKTLIQCGGPTPPATGHNHSILVSHKITITAHQQSCTSMESSIPGYSSSSTSFSPSSSFPRLWRPAAQRNLRNQWSNLLFGKERWVSAVAKGRSIATELVNTYLFGRYMPEMDFGALEDMSEIREKAARKLAAKQESWRIKLLSSYKDLVAIVCHLVNTSSSMRCFLKGSDTMPLVRFSDNSESAADLGDGGGISVFKFWSISHFEMLARELVDMFCSELIFKRLLVVTLLFVSCQNRSTQQSAVLSWSDELYPGEFEALNTCNLISKENHQPLYPETKDSASSDTVTGQFDAVLSGELHQFAVQDTLQFYLTMWFSDVKVDTCSFEDTIRMVEEEMQVKLS